MEKELSEAGQSYWQRRHLGYLKPTLLSPLRKVTELVFYPLIRRCSQNLLPTQLSWGVKEREHGALRGKAAKTGQRIWLQRRNRPLWVHSWRLVLHEYTCSLTSSRLSKSNSASRVLGDCVPCAPGTGRVLTLEVPPASCGFPHDTHSITQRLIPKWAPAAVSLSTSCGCQSQKWPSFCNSKSLLIPLFWKWHLGISAVNSC